MGNMSLLEQVHSIDSERHYQGDSIRHPYVRLMIVLLFSGVVGLLLLIAVNLLPAERIKNHIADGAYVILQESAEFEYADGYVSAILDNYTDSVILSKTAYPSNHPLLDAVNVPSYSWPGQSAEDMEIFGYLNGNSTDDAVIDTYPRYWHGYMAVLKPFFTLFGYADLRIINQMVQTSLLMAVVFCMIRKGLHYYLPAFIAMILFWNPATMGVSLQYSPCYYVSMLATLLILLRTHCVGWYRDAMLFLLIGITTAYVDFLTYPLATLGVPLVMWVITRSERAYGSDGDQPGIRPMLVSCIRLGLCWAAGYLGMWAEKWIYGSILTSTNILADAASAVTDRTSANNGSETISRLGTVLYLIRRAFGSWGGIALALSALIAVTILGLHMRRDTTMYKDSQRLPARVIMLICIGILPFIWYFLTANHSYIHPRLVYRTMGITVFAWLSAWMLLISRRGDSKPASGGTVCKE